MNIRNAIRIAVVMVVLGCQIGCEDASSRELREIRRDAEAYRDVLASGNGGDLEPQRALLARIKAVPDADLRRQCYDELKTLVFAIDLQKLADEPNKFVRCRSGVRDLSFSLMGRAAAPSAKEECETKLMYLRWLREHAKMLEVAASDYPAGVTCWLDLSGCPQLKADKENAQTLKKYRGVLRCYASCAAAYEADVEWCERVFVNSLFGKAELIEIRKMLEEFLGQRLRTKAECDADGKINRRLEFPYLVLRPDGIHKEWTKK